MEPLANKAGNEKAEELIRTWRGYVYTIISNKKPLYSDKSLEVNDVVQEVMIKIWKARDRIYGIPEGTERKKYIATIAHNHYKDILKSKNYQNQTLTDNYEHEPPRPIFKLMDLSNELLTDFLKKLTPEDIKLIRVVIRSRNQTEAAKKLGCDQSTISRMAKKLRERLSE